MFKTPIILASQSPRRKTLLEWAEVPFTVMVAGTDESFPATMEPEQIPIHIAEAKAVAVQQQLASTQGSAANTIIIAADTVVVLDGLIMNKPANRDEAIQMLKQLSGKKHRVITGVVLRLNAQVESFSETTYVQFHILTEAQIAYYVDQYQPYDKAGGYAIQEWIGVIGIEAIEGDFYNVMGLPVSRVVRALTSLDQSIQ